MQTFDRKGLSDEELISFYRQLLLPRMIEEKMLVLLRQGKVSKWFSGIGQEAISVGATLALQSDEWIMPLHRNLGVFTTRGMPLEKLFLQWQGRKGGYSKGRERSFHFGSKEHHICGMISHLGPQLTLANGTALAHRLQQEDKVSLAFTGDGGTSEGDFHEALNLASVWDLPVIFIIENNGYGLSTPVHEQYRCERLVDRAHGYGMEGVRIFGNDILAVYDTVRGVRDYCIRHKRPYLIECMTFRMRGHEEASGTKYVPDHLFEQWSPQDPLTLFGQQLEAEGILSSEALALMKEDLSAYIEESIAAGLTTDTEASVPAEELKDMYAMPFVKSDPQPEAAIARTSRFQRPVVQSDEETSEAADKDIRFVDAIHDGLALSMERHPNLILMGQDIAEYGGVFKVTEGFWEKFGKERVRNTPLCESAIIGAALGLSLEGYKSMVEMQFADFISSGFNQVVNNIAKIHYRWGQHADVVIRMPTGAGVGAGPFHSQSNEAWFVHTPGLKVVYPSSPEDAKGLLISAFNDPDPVIFFEHKALYRSISGHVPQGYYETPIGQARQVRTGKDVSIITYGAGVHWAIAYADAHPETSFDILDLRTLLPIDYDAIRESVLRSGKVMLLHEDTLTGGMGAEVAAWIAEHCFEHLDAPVMRCASLDTPVPFAPQLEQQFLAKQRMDEVVSRLLEY